MTIAAWLGIDLGTQGVRATLVETGGRVLGTGSVGITARDAIDRSMTHDPVLDWSEGTIEAIRLAIEGSDPRRIAGIGTCGLFPAVVLVGRDGRPIGEAVLYGDGRAAAFRPEVERRLGVSLLGDEVSPRLMWMRDERATDLDRAAWALGPTGFVVHLLTGIASIDPHSAFRWGGLVDANRTAWDRDAAGTIGIRAELLPPIVAPHATAGAVTTGLADRTGLRAGTPVIAGTTDSFATFLGHGAVRRGDVIVYYGSSGTLMACTVDLSSVLREPAMIADGVPWRLAAYALDSGRLLESLRASMLAGRSYGDLDRAASSVPPGSNGVVLIPHVRGRFDGRAIRPAAAAVVGFGLSDGPGTVWRAALEAFGHVLIDGIERLPGPPGRVVAAGGGSRSRVWRSIVDEMTGLAQSHDPRGSAAFGAAFLAAYGLGGVTRLDPIAEGWLSAEASPVDREGDEARARYSHEHAAWRIHESAVAPWPAGGSR